MILLQAISILFSVAAAVISAPIVSRFEINGATVKQIDKLHSYTFWIKVVVCLVIMVISWELFSGLFFALWDYLLFDVVLNRLRKPKRHWDYLGLNDNSGRFWNGTFGVNAGRWKACILIFILILTNFIYYNYGN